MSESFQDVYAKYLRQWHVDYGYPLRMPEPMSTLPQSYQATGLEIGDVGIIDNEGQFDVLFNICKPHDDVLHERHGVPKNFQSAQVQKDDVKLSDDVIAPGPIYSDGIKRILKPDEQSIRNYEFDSSTPGGAILILPHGAKSVELSSPEPFRELAVRNALDWYEFAKKRYGVKQLDRSLYLITGFYKARSWSLGSFNNPTNTNGKILAKRVKEDSDVYLLEFPFPADCRSSRNDAGGNVNQTVFIAGFRIAVSSWLQDPVILNLKVTESETSWDTLARLFKASVRRIPSLIEAQKHPVVISIEPRPQLSQSNREILDDLAVPYTVLQPPPNAPTNLRSREESLRLAKAAERDKHWEDMVDHMKDIAFSNWELTTEERDLFSSGYECLIATRRASCDRQKLEGETIRICDEVVHILDKHLIPSTTSTESVVLYCRMVGDYYRCASDFCVERQREEYIEKSLAAFEAASSIAKSGLSATHPIRLQLALNLSLLYHEVLYSPDEAIRVADKALEDASIGLEGLCEKDREDASAIMQSLRDKATGWKLEEKEKHKDGQCDHCDVDETNGVKDATKVDDDLMAFVKGQVVSPPLALGSQHKLSGKKLDRREQGPRTKALRVSDIIREEMPRKRLVQETITSN